MNSSDNSAEHHRVTAEKCRRLSQGMLGPDRDTLLVMAAQHENKAEEAERCSARPKLALKI
ncbi:hypothetical protein [Sphingomonas xinjiangensis]|uniref:hypothetical protein n=1 Tax=Sphingomonas xinjiangensis TaxID=643568 RepID=UPI001C8534B8|nr:hypothetical protein [Sphingomonas xinjiangensis]